MHTHTYDYARKNTHPRTEKLMQVHRQKDIARERKRERENAAKHSVKENTRARTYGKKHAHNSCEKILPEDENSCFKRPEYGWDRVGNYTVK